MITVAKRGYDLRVHSMLTGVSRRLKVEAVIREVVVR
jgi:hypothetical protein